MLLNREEFFEETALQTERVPVGKGEIIVSEIGATDYLELYSKYKCRDEDGNVDSVKFTNVLILLSVVNEGGERFFTDDDLSRLARTKPKVYLEIANAAKRVNGLSGDEKNSEPSLTDSLPLTSV